MSNIKSFPTRSDVTFENDTLSPSKGETCLFVAVNILNNDANPLQYATYLSVMSGIKQTPGRNSAGWLVYTLGYSFDCTISTARSPYTVTLAHSLLKCNNIFKGNDGLKPLQHLPHAAQAGSGDRQG